VAPARPAPAHASAPAHPRPPSLPRPSKKVYIPLIATGVFTVLVIALPLVYEKLLSDEQRAYLSGLFSRAPRTAGGAGGSPAPGLYSDDKAARALRVQLDDGRDQAPRNAATAAAPPPPALPPVLPPAPALGAPAGGAGAPQGGGWGTRAGNGAGNGGAAPY
jgi:hypothetical protein